MRIFCHGQDSQKTLVLGGGSDVELPDPVEEEGTAASADAAETVGGEGNGAVNFELPE